MVDEVYVDPRQNTHIDDPPAPWQKHSTLFLASTKLDLSMVKLDPSTLWLLPFTQLLLCMHSSFPRVFSSIFLSNDHYLVAQHKILYALFHLRQIKVASPKNKIALHR